MRFTLSATIQSSSVLNSSSNVRSMSTWLLRRLPGLVDSTLSSSESITMTSRDVNLDLPSFCRLKKWCKVCPGWTMLPRNIFKLEAWDRLRSTWSTLISCCKWLLPRLMGWRTTSLNNSIIRWVDVSIIASSHVLLYLPERPELLSDGAMWISSYKPIDKTSWLTIGPAMAPSLKPTSILHRTPWQPPVAESAQGIYITLEDGTLLIDAVGGAAVTCIGNSHPKVMQAIKDQVDKVSCMRFRSLMHIYHFWLHNHRRLQYAII